MHWQRQLGAAWRQLAPGPRRLLIGAGIAGVVLIVVGFAGPRDLQLAAVLMLVGLLLLTQTVILWSLWRRNPAFRQAQRAFMRGDFEAVLQALGPQPADPASQTLLGNTYRQLGRLEESEQTLRAAHEADPDAPFAAYGLGRTLLAQGRYNEAAGCIQHALDRRAQPTIVADLGHARYRAGSREEAAAALARAERLELEPHRALMTRYLLWRLSGQAADNALRARLARYDHGLEVWQAEAARFRHTPYGLALLEDIAHVERLLGEVDHEYQAS